MFFERRDKINKYKYKKKTSPSPVKKRIIETTCNLLR